MRGDQTVCGLRQLQQDRRPRERRRQPRQLPLPPEIGQGGDDVHRTEGRAAVRRAARSAARPRAWAPSAAAISGASPCASAVPTSPLSTSPLPPVARPGLPAATVSGARPSRAMTVGTPLSSTVAPDRSAAWTAAAQGSSSRTRREVGKEGAEFARVRRQHQRAAPPPAREARPQRPERRRARRHRATAVGAARTRAATRALRPGSRPSPGPDHQRVGAPDQLEQLRCRRLVECDGRSVCRSGSACISAATVSGGATTWTRPAPAANAARPAMRAAPAHARRARRR